MLWRRHTQWLAVSVFSCQLVLGGCRAAERPAIDGYSPDFTTLLKLPGSEAAVARGQQPPQPPVKSLLELGPESPGNRDTRTARIRATVNGEAILDEEVTAAAMQGLLTARTEAEKAEVMNQKLTEIIERELLMQDAIARLSKRGGMRFYQELEKVAEREFEKQWLHRLMRANHITDLDTFTRMLRDQGMPVDLVRRQWVRNFIAMEYLRTRVEPQLNKIGHKEVEEYYEKNRDDFKVEDKVVWQDIFIANVRHPTPAAARQFAEVLMERIRKGEDFVKLAKEFDNGDSSLRENAEGIGNKRGEILPREAEQQLFQLKDGQLGPLIELETGFHISRLTKRTYAGRTPFDDRTQKQIREKLKGVVFQQEMRKVINELKRSAIIEVARDVK
jgi:hypothetical protein